MPEHPRPYPIGRAVRLPLPADFPMVAMGTAFAEVEEVTRRYYRFVEQVRQDDWIRAGFDALDSLEEMR